jgi:RNA polymerase sigma factor (sigma-70 family)
MMAAMPAPSPRITGAPLPPFERFYEAHRDDVFRYLVRMVGRQAAEDAFQETFLRALRAYPDLRHAENLRGWAFTIATRVALDERRRDVRIPAHVSTDGGPPEVADPSPAGPGDAGPAYAELARFADALPHTERAAVVLRYGYDLAYADIAAALGSTEEAARQATSSGVRRLRRKGIR